MKQILLPATLDKPEIDYCGLSSPDLVHRIVYLSDVNALDEFHTHRKLFSYNGSEPMLFIEFLTALYDSTTQSEWLGRHNFEIADLAYDLTVDKFSNLPGADMHLVSFKKKSTLKLKPTGADCRLYLRASLKRLKFLCETAESTDQLTEEYLLAKLVQGLVRRQYYLSRLEAQRKINAFWSRYYWHTKGVNICLWLPKILKGHDRRKWLEKNILDPDPTYPDEGKRIQEIIKKRFSNNWIVSLDDPYTIQDIHDRFQPVEWDGLFHQTLAMVVADEKANNIQVQRSAIKYLGEHKLKQLIFQIFEDIINDDFQDSQVAQKFGLSKSTFSRFAGSRWDINGKTIPDLWMNTASILSAHPEFQDAAKKAGVWPQVMTTISNSKRN